MIKTAEIYKLHKSRTLNLKPWTNLSWKDKPWAEFSTLEVAVCHATHLLHCITIQSNLELKTHPKQQLGSLPLDIALPAQTQAQLKQLRQAD